MEKNKCFWNVDPGLDPGRSSRAGKPIWEARGAKRRRTSIPSSQGGRKMRSEHPKWNGLWRRARSRSDLLIGSVSERASGGEREQLQKSYLRTFCGCLSRGRTDAPMTAVFINPSELSLEPSIHSPPPLSPINPFIHRSASLIHPQRSSAVSLSAGREQRHHLKKSPQDFSVSEASAARRMVALSSGSEIFCKGGSVFRRTRFLGLRRWKIAQSQHRMIIG